MRLEMRMEMQMETPTKRAGIIEQAGIEERIREITRNRSAILEHFAEAYLAETGLMPSEVELVQEYLPQGVKIYFRKR